LTPTAASTLVRIAKKARAFTYQVVPNNRLNVTMLRVSRRRNATPRRKKCANRGPKLASGRRMYRSVPPRPSAASASMIARPRM